MGETRIPWATYGPDPADAPWRHDRHHPMLGRNLPWVRVPDWPDIEVVPAHQLDKVAPTGFRAYTRVGHDVLCDYGVTFEESKYNLRRMVEAR